MNGNFPLRWRIHAWANSFAAFLALVGVTVIIVSGVNPNRNFASNLQANSIAGCKRTNQVRRDMDKVKRSLEAFAAALNESAVADPSTLHTVEGFLKEPIPLIDCNRVFK